MPGKNKKVDLGAHYRVMNQCFIRLVILNCMYNSTKSLSLYLSLSNNQFYALSVIVEWNNAVSYIYMIERKKCYGTNVQFTSSIDTLYPTNINIVIIKFPKKKFTKGIYAIPLKFTCPDLLIWAVLWKLFTKPYHVKNSLPKKLHVTSKKQLLRERLGSKNI